MGNAVLDFRRLEFTLERLFGRTLNRELQRIAISQIAPLVCYGDTFRLGCINRNNPQFEGLTSQNDPIQLAWVVSEIGKLISDSLTLFHSLPRDFGGASAKRKEAIEAERLPVQI